MTNPIDIIANAMRAADGGHTMGTGALAEVAASALIDERIVANAAQALYDAGWTPSPNDKDAKAIVETVLRSVGGA